MVAGKGTLYFFKISHPPSFRERHHKSESERHRRWSCQGLSAHGAIRLLQHSACWWSLYSGYWDDPLSHIKKSQVTLSPFISSLSHSTLPAPTLLTPAWNSTCANLERLVVKETNRHLFARCWEVLSLPPLLKIGCLRHQPCTF